MRVHRSTLIIRHCFSGLCDMVEEVRNDGAVGKRPLVGSGRHVSDVSVSKPKNDQDISSGEFTH